MSKNALNIFFLLPGVILLIAPIFSLPYGFYTFLRLAVSVSAIFIIYNSYQTNKGVDVILIIFAIIFILYNPFIPIHLTREIWMPINFITAAIYFYGFYKVNRKVTN